MYKLGLKLDLPAAKYKLCDLLALAPSVKPLPAVDWLTKNSALYPNSFGMMLNDSLGDCTCAAYYHLLQLWSFAVMGRSITECDADVLKMYEMACGYNPADPSTDQGGDELVIEAWLQKVGAPTGLKGQTHHKILGHVDVDITNLDEVKLGLQYFGGLYIGFQVPQNIMPDDAPPPRTWTVDPSNNPIIGGHAVAVGRYDDSGMELISWGQSYLMPWAFWQTYVVECHCIMDKDFLTTMGRTPLGLTPAQTANILQP